MKLSAKLITAVVAALLAFSAAASARSTSGTVLQLDARHHVMRVVSGPKSVSSYRYAGRLRGVRPGTVVRFDAAGHRAARVRAAGRARRLRVYAKVLRSSSGGTTFSLPDGRPFTLNRGVRGHALRVAGAAHNVSVDVQGLKPGQTVLITVSFDANGDVHITITLVDDGSGSDPGTNDPGSGECGNPDATAGTVTSIDHAAGEFTISRPWGDDPQTYAAGEQLLAHIHVGDEVLVHYTGDDSTVDDVKVVKSSVVAPDPGMGSADGTVNSVEADAGRFTVIQSNRSGRLTFTAPCTILNNVWTSEDVHVVYHREASGELVADAVDANDGTEFERP